MPEKTVFFLGQKKKLSPTFLKFLSGSLKLALFCIFSRVDIFLWGRILPAGVKILMG